jgi:glutamate-1-semialdehyde 2,1-aminomutase
MRSLAEVDGRDGVDVESTHGGPPGNALWDGRRRRGLRAGRGADHADYHRAGPPPARSAVRPVETPTTDLFARAARVLAGGATHVARTYRPPIHVVAARGTRKWLTDGREIVDYTMGHGALLLGHAHPAIVDAVTAQVARGTHYGAASELEVAWAERIVDLVPAAHRVRFTSSGTEAVMLALRLARAATGREVVVKFAGHFHGWSDGVTVDLDETGLPRPAVGVPTAVATTTRVVRPDDAAALDGALGDGAAAALVLEPAGGPDG